MKLIRKLIALSAALIMLLTLSPAALAADAEGDSPVWDTSALIEGKSWDEVIEAFLDEMNIREDQVGIGYRNTVTGEEHFLNGDEYYDAASLYKVPLNMYYAELISKGEMELDSTVYAFEYKYLMESSIINSSNESAVYLYEYMGGYMTYRKEIARFMGVDKDNADPEYYANNLFTPEQEIYCLNLLATESDRFPYIIDCMKQAEPQNYFRRDETRFEIAHKYGWDHNYDEDIYYVNDSAIIYTDEPIVITMFTKSVVDIYTVLARFCTLMCDYAQYHTALDREEASRLSASMGEKLTETVDSGMSDLPQLTSSGSGDEMPDNISVKDLSFGSLVMLVLIMVATVVALVMLIKYASMKKMRFLWGLPAIIFAAAGLTACVLGTSLGTLLTITSGDPAQVVDTFFSSVINGDYERAYSCLSDYTDLGLGTVPEDPVAAKLCTALRKSYSYRINGEARVDGLTASQQVEFRYFDLTKLSGDLETAANDYIEEVVAKRSRSELYDAEDHYLPEVTDEVYNHSIDTVLSHASDYYTTVIIDVDLKYSDGTWSLSTSQPMLNALTGGIAY